MALYRPPAVPLALCQRPPFANSSYLIVQPSRNIPPEPKPAFFNLLCSSRLPSWTFLFRCLPLAWCPCALRVGSPLEDWPATTSLRRLLGLCWTPSVDQFEPSRVQQLLIAIKGERLSSIVAGVTFRLVSPNCVELRESLSTPNPSQKPTS